MVALYELDQMCFRPGIAYSFEDLQSFLLDPASITVIAEDKGADIAGFATLELYRERASIVGHIVTLDVHPNARRIGLGGALMRVLREITEGAGGDLLRLEVASDDEGAQQFYLHLGFQTVSRLEKYYLDKIDGFLMEQRIQPKAH